MKIDNYDFTYIKMLASGCKVFKDNNEPMSDSEKLIAIYNKLLDIATE